MKTPGKEQEWRYRRMKYFLKNKFNISMKSTILKISILSFIFISHYSVINSQPNFGTWSNLGSGVNGSITSIVVSGNEIYVGGYFTVAGDINVNNIAKWNGSVWSPLGSGVNGTVLSLALLGGDLYVGGQFTIAGGISANRIAKWDGVNWTALGDGLDDDVLSIATKDGIVYAGGDFLNAGILIVNYIASWDGLNWSTLDGGMNGPVLALSIFGSNIIAGGGFTTGGSTPANYIAYWNGSNWNPLSSGMDNPVEAIAVNEDNLYAGGAFVTSGGITTNRIAKWDGTIWSALGNGSIDEIRAVSVRNNIVYAGGLFSRTIQVWNGSNWLSMGNDVFFIVNSLATDGIKVYAGGSFGIKRWDPLPEVETENATEITYNSVKLNGNVNPNEIETSGYFYYSVDDLFGEYDITTLQNMGNGSSIISFSQNLTDLEPNTTYYYYAVGDNGLGLGVGEVSSFTTDDVLPVEMELFYSVIHKRDVQLYWITSSEYNNSGFDIERKLSSNDIWINLGNIPGIGNSSKPINYSFSDNGLVSGTYYYRLKQIDYNGNYQFYNLENEVTIGIPERFYLSQNYPNPFNPRTKIDFNLPADSEVILKLYDITGSEIKTIVNNFELAGYHSVRFDASGIPSGIYFYKLKAGEFSDMKKMILIK
jgi:hypothetical protein